MSRKYPLERRSLNHRRSGRKLSLERLEDRRLLAVDFQLVKDTNSNAPDISVASAPRSFTQVGNITFFAASTPLGGRELWKTDGTASGTIVVKHIGNPENFTNVNGTLYFTANRTVTGTDLWKSDGTEA